MRLKRWERWTEWPLTILSVAFIVIYAWQVLAEPTGYTASIADVSMNVMWAVFALDYVVSLTLAEHRWTWFTHHLFDLLVVLLPMIRPLRVLRILTALHALHRTSGMALRGRIAVYVSSSVLVLILIGSLAILDAERHAPGATITTYPKALWWTVVTITTVGYGDYSPITPTGRVIALAIMLAGIALIGVVTATLASWIVDEVSAEEQRSADITRAQVDELNQRLRHIEDLIAHSDTDGSTFHGDNPQTPSNNS